MYIRNGEIQKCRTELSLIYARAIKSYGFDWDIKYKVL